MFPESSAEDRDAWSHKLFIQQPLTMIRAECTSFGTGPDSIFKVEPENFDLGVFSQEINTRAPVLTTFLSTLLEADKPSREKKLAEERREIKALRATFIFSQIMFSRSQQNNAFQSFLGIQFKFPGLSKVVRANCLYSRGMPVSPWDLCLSLCLVSASILQAASAFLFLVEQFSPELSGSRTQQGIR